MSSFGWRSQHAKVKFTERAGHIPTIQWPEIWAYESSIERAQERAQDTQERAHREHLGEH